MKELVEALKVALADSYAFSVKSQNYHWNVTGPMFSEYHAFFGGLYEEVSGGIDIIAEGIRTLNAFSPASFKRFSELTSIKDELNIPPAHTMMNNLLTDNDTVLASLTRAYEAAENAKKYGISNFLQDRITAHEKWKWQIKSFIHP